MRPLKKFWRKLVRPEVVVEDGLKICVGSLARTRGANSVYNGRHELPERTVVRKTLTAEDRVLEIGAGLGLVTMLCCRLVGADRVHTCEANPELYPLLEKSFALNRQHPELIRGLVGLQAGEQELYTGAQFASSSRYAQAIDPATRSVTRVPVIPLASLLARVQPTYLIMDAEGAEADLLDARTSLTGVHKICVEVHPKLIGDDAINGILDALREQGFVLSWLHSRDKVLYFHRPAALSAARAA